SALVQLATRLAARRHPLPDAEIDGAEVSWRCPGDKGEPHAGLRVRRPCQMEFRNARPPTAPTLPLIGGTTAGAAGSSHIKIHRLPVCPEGPRDAKHVVVCCRCSRQVLTRSRHSPAH